jgi:hypothetical protein
MFATKIARYNMILTGKAPTDTTIYFHLREFKGVDTPAVPPDLPMIDDFELNSTIPYPAPFGNSLPRIQYNWAIRKSSATALQIYFNPQQAASPDSAGTGGIRTVLPDGIDLSSYGAIQFYLKGDGTQNFLRLQLVEADRSGAMKLLESSPVALQDTAWQLVALPLACFAERSSRGTDSQFFLTGYNFVFEGQEAPDETKDFIFIDALQVGADGGFPESDKLPVIDSYEGDLRCGFEKFGPSLLSWTSSPIATHGNSSLAVTYQYLPADSIRHNWGAGLRRILPKEIDLRFYKNLEFDLSGDGSLDSMRVELIESRHAPADGETWASRFFALDQPAWRRIVLNLDEDFHLLLDRTDNIYPDYVDGNHIRNHQFREYHLVFVGRDLTPKTQPVRLDNLSVSGKEKPDRDTVMDSLIISEPRFSPLRGNVIFKYQLRQPAAVTLKIYRLSGELMAEISSSAMQPAGRNILEWNGANRHGQVLPNGLYLVLAKTKTSEGLEQDGLGHPKFIEILK